MKKQIMKVMVVVAILFSGVTAAFAQEVELYFTGSKYQSDETCFRATSTGQSPDLAKAQTIAIANTKGVLAGLIETKVQDVYKEYFRQCSTCATGKNGQYATADKIYNMKNQVVNQVLSNMRIIGEKAVQEGGVYRYYVAMEIPVPTVKEAMEKIITDQGFMLDEKAMEQVMQDQINNY